MDIAEALALIEQEEADDGLLLLFRMSHDIPEQKLDKFIEALGVIENHYQGIRLIEKELVNKLLWFYRTLSASASHWKVSHPKGLTPQRVFEVNKAILDVFTDDSIS